MLAQKRKDPDPREAFRYYQVGSTFRYYQVGSTFRYYQVGSTFRYYQVGSTFIYYQVGSTSRYSNNQNSVPYSAVLSLSAEKDQLISAQN